MKKSIVVAVSVCHLSRQGGAESRCNRAPFRSISIKREYDVRVILPKYLCMSEEWKSKIELCDSFYIWILPGVPSTSVCWKYRV